MVACRSSSTPALDAALMETFAHALRTQVYVSVYERPGATIAQLAGRLDQPARRVRDQIDRLIAAGLVVVETETRRRNARERHYRAVAVPTVDEQGDLWTDEDRGKMVLSLMKFIAADVGRAFRRRTFGTRPGHAEVRIPGEVDERGWVEIGAIVTGAMAQMEGIMIDSVGRLEAAGESGIEAISALLLFEAPAWERRSPVRRGPRRSQWIDARSHSIAASASRAVERVRDLSHLKVDLRDPLVEALSDPLRAQVFIAVAERPGVTIGEAATRIGESPRRVRHQIERLVEAGLIAPEGETSRRNTRERHYRAVSLPNIIEEAGSGWIDEQRRRIARSMIGVIMADLDRAVGNETIAARPGLAVVRIPGEVDETGWRALAGRTLEAMAAIEMEMIRSAARLEDARRPGIEVLSALLLFEASPWEQVDGERRGPRPTNWRPGRRGEVC